MKLKLFTSDATKSSEKEFNLPTFEGNRGLQAVKEVVVAHRANARQGTRSTKTRGEVSGGGKKPWAQKGTGRARAGSIRSPLWSGGGVVFGPKPRDYSKKINAKVKQLAFSRALFDRASAGELAVIEQFDASVAIDLIAFVASGPAEADRVAGRIGLRGWPPWPRRRFRRPGP